MAVQTLDQNTWARRDPYQGYKASHKAEIDIGRTNVKVTTKKIETAVQETLGCPEATTEGNYRIHRDCSAEESEMTGATFKSILFLRASTTRARCLEHASRSRTAHRSGGTVEHGMTVEAAILQ